MVNTCMHASTSRSCRAYVQQAIRGVRLHLELQVICVGTLAVACGLACSCMSGKVVEPFPTQQLPQPGSLPAACRSVIMASVLAMASWCTF